MSAKTNSDQPRLLLEVKRTSGRQLIVALPSGQILKMDLETAQGLALALASVAAGKSDEAQVRVSPLLSQ